MAYLIRSKGWAIQVPDTWKSEAAENPAVLSPYFVRDSVLLITTLGCWDAIKEELVAIAVLRAQEESASYSEVQFGAFTGFHSSYVEEEPALRAWRLFSHDILLHVVYACAMSRQGKDDVTVDEMLRTIRYLPAA